MTNEDATNSESDTELITHLKVHEFMERVLTNLDDVPPELKTALVDASRNAGSNATLFRMALEKSAGQNDGAR